MDLIPNYYEFQNSAKLLSGERALENIPYELSVRGCSRPMLMSDRVLEKFGAVATVTAALSVQCVRDMTAKFHEVCGLPVTLSQAGVRREDFEAVARTALNDGAMIVNPRQVTFDDVMTILDKAY